MAFGYEFVSLTPERVEARRKQLDQAGFRGYLLPVVLLLATHVFRNLSKAISGASETTVKRPNAFQIWSRRLNWILSDTYLSEFGPLHVQLLGLGYTSILLFLIIKGTGNDYMHVAKAFGHVAVSQLPVHYLLSIKHPLSPITIATGLTHERLNAYHRLLGRVIHVLLAVHAVLYLNFFIAINALSKRVKDWDVIYGLTAFWTVNLIGLLAVPPIRQKVYHKVFYRSHVTLSILLAAIVWLHVPYTRNYAAQAAFFWISNGILRKGRMAEPVTIRGQKVGGGLIELTAILKSGMTWEAWLPGMHGYINQGGVGPRTPFTVVDVFEKNGQAQAKFVVRDLGGPTTGLLGRAAATDKSLTLELEGPYGEAREYMPDVLKRTKEPTLVVAGGVGATYALPIYLALAEKRKDVANLRFVWLVKNMEDAKWGCDMLRGKAHRNVHIHITQSKADTAPVTLPSMSGVDTTSLNSRPDFSTIVDSFLGSPAKADTSFTVMVCGPSGLSTALRKAVGRYAWSGGKVRWYEEQFGFGGS